MIETKRFLVRLIVYPVSVIASFVVLSLCTRFFMDPVIDSLNPAGPGLGVGLGMALMFVFGFLSLFVIAPIMTYLAMIWCDRRIGYKQNRKKAAHPY